MSAVEVGRPACIPPAFPPITCMAALATAACDAAGFTLVIARRTWCALRVVFGDSIARPGSYSRRRLPFPGPWEAFGGGFQERPEAGGL